MDTLPSSILLNQLKEAIDHLLCSNTFDNTKDFVPNLKEYMLHKTRMYTTFNDYHNVLKQVAKGNLAGYNCQSTGDFWEGDEGVKRHQLIDYLSSELKLCIQNHTSFKPTLE